MRVSDSMTFTQVRDNVGRNRTDMSDLQNQAATQKRVTKPSDDPVAAARVLGNRVDLRANQQYQRSLNYAQSFLELTDQSLGEVTEQLVRVKELAISQANDPGSNEDSRRVVGLEIAQIFDQLVAIGNRKMGDRFIFGGYKTLSRPFDAVGKYMGDDNEMIIHVDKESNVAMNIPGSKVFLGEGLSADGIAHPSRRQPKSAEELQQQLVKERQESEVEVRGPASDPDKDPHTGPLFQTGGINIFSVVQKLGVALETNDKVGVQEMLEDVDHAVTQVVLARAQVGSRSATLRETISSLQQREVDTQGSISQLEDADIFRVVSDINKTESTLQATLQTAGKIMPKSLLDFVR